MPCDYSKYPPNWKTEIRPRILLRDNNCCHFCGIANYTQGWRFPSGAFYTVDQIAGDYMLESDECVCDEILQKPIQKIVLTIMHLDHDTTNNADSNLAAGCQRCHNRYDIEHRKKNRQTTVQNKKYLHSLFNQS